VSAPKLPVICVNESVVQVYDSEERFNRATLAASKPGGWFDGQLVVDSLLNGYRVARAEVVGVLERKLWGVGPPQRVTVRRIYRRGGFRCRWKTSEPLFSGPWPQIAITGRN
jgi:hypothetical protein